MGDRITPHEPNFSTTGNIVYDAEVEELGMFSTCCLTLMCCTSYDKIRSYLILREDELEANFATQHPCCCMKFDFYVVRRYDRLFGYTESWPCNCCPLRPNINLQQIGCTLCLQRFVCCRRAVLVPYEYYCCCCPNAVGYCDTCFELCGCGILGSPKLFSMIAPATLPFPFSAFSCLFTVEPKDPEAFVNKIRPLIEAKTGLSAKQFGSN